MFCEKHQPHTKTKTNNINQQQQHTVKKPQKTTEERLLIFSHGSSTLTIHFVQKNINEIQKQQPTTETKQQQHTTKNNRREIAHLLKRQQDFIQPHPLHLSARQVAAKWGGVLSTPHELKVDAPVHPVGSPSLVEARRTVRATRKTREPAAVVVHAPADHSKGMQSTNFVEGLFASRHPGPWLLLRWE